MYVKDGRKVVIDDLSKHEHRRLAMGNLKAKIAELDADFGRLQAVKFDTVSVQGYKTSMEERLVKSIAERDELRERLRKTTAAWKRVEGALKQLSGEERKILQRFYIFNSSSEERMALCDELNVERSELYRRKDMALEKLDLILYGEGRA